jgi:hypothetical protein
MEVLALQYYTVVDSKYGNDGLTCDITMLPILCLVQTVQYSMHREHLIQCQFPAISPSAGVVP